MKKILLLALTINAFCSIAQEGFINSYDIERPGVVFSNLLLNEDTIVVTGLILSDSIPQAQGILFVKLDTFGNVIEYTMHFDSMGYNYGLGDRPNGFIKLKNGTGYLVLTGEFETTDGVLLKLDLDGNLVWKNKYPDSTSLQDYYKRIVETKDGFLLLGRKFKSNGQGDIFIMKLDENGEKKWEKYFGTDGRNDDATNILMVNDNEYVIGGSTGDNQNVPWQEWQNTVKIFAIDSLGNEKWSWESGPSLEELWIKGLQRTNNGGWAYATARGEFEPDGYMKRQARFIIRDSSFNIVEERLLDDLDLGFYNYLLDLEPASDGGWIGVGANFEWVTDPVWAESHVYAWMVRIDETGDTLWTRNDLAFPDTPTYASLQFLHSAVELPGGSVIAAGYYQPDGPGANLGILIKVDRDGCLVGCSPLNVAGWLDVPKTEVSVFPNPAKNKVTVEMPLPLTTEMGWSLYDAIGQRVLFHTLQKGITSTDIPLKSIPPGLYFWELRNGKGKVGGRKLVVVK